MWTNNKRLRRYLEFHQTDEDFYIMGIQHTNCFNAYKTYYVILSELHTRGVAVGGK
jgi:hypothetical protein